MDAIDEKVFFGVNILLPCSCVWSHVIVVAHDHKSRTMFNFCGRVKWPVIGCDLHRNSHIIPLDRAWSRKNLSVGSQELTMSCRTIPEAVLFSQIRAATLSRVESVLKPRKNNWSRAVVSQPIAATGNTIAQCITTLATFLSILRQFFREHVRILLVSFQIKFSPANHSQKYCKLLRSRFSVTPSLGNL